MIELESALWPQLLPILSGFVGKICASDPELRRHVGRTANGVFSLRGYGTFSKGPQGAEIAITVDTRVIGQNLNIESDVCIDDGEIIASGPLKSIELDRLPMEVDAEVEEWLREFTDFLSANELLISLAVAQLK